MAKNKKITIIGNDVTFFHNNPDFNLTEFRYIRNESGGNGVQR